MMLRNETGRGFLFWGEGGAIDEAPQFPVVEDQRILHRGQLLIESNLIFVKVLTSDKASLVVCLFNVTVGVETGYLAMLDTIAPDLIETRTRPVDKDHGFDDLLGGILGVLLVVLLGVFVVLLGVLLGLWFSGWRGLCLAGQGYRDYERGKS